MSYTPLPPIRASFTPIVSLSFDPVSDTLWSASGNTVSALYGLDLQQGVVFPAGGMVRRVVAAETSVRVASDVGVGAWAKGGANKWIHATPMSPTTISATAPHSTTLYLATVASDLTLLSATTGTASRTIRVPSIVTQLCTSVHSSASVVFAGHADGHVRTFDVRTLQSRGTSSVAAHPGGIQGLAVASNYVYSIGSGARHSLPDRFIKVYDIRSLRNVASIPFPAGPAFISPHVPSAGTIVAASDSGLMQVVNASDPGAAESFSITTQSFVSSLCSSPTGAYIAVGDAEGAIYILNSTAPDLVDAPFNGFEGQPVELPDPPEPESQVVWTERTPLNSIGIPYFTSTLLSAFGGWENSIVANAEQVVPPQILQNMKTVDGVGYASLPKERKGMRNVLYKAPLDKADEGRFRSDRRGNKSPDPETPLELLPSKAIPRWYRRVEIAYSKFGVEDFDFGFYNHTPYAGLETHVANSYTNSFVQLLHYCLPVRLLATAHISGRCEREACLACELGFVFRMLEDAKGAGGEVGHCQAANLGRVLGMTPQASAMGLVDYVGSEGRRHNYTDYASMIQVFNRFAVDLLASEIGQLLSVPGAPSNHDSITQLFGLAAPTFIRCESCGTVKVKETLSRVTDLVYPRKLSSNDPTPLTNFEAILRDSLERRSSHKATCSNCHRMSGFESRRDLGDSTNEMPSLLLLNANVGGISSGSALDIWRSSPNFLPASVVVSAGQSSVTYEVKGIVIQVGTRVSHEETDASATLSIGLAEGTGHLVALIKVPESEVAPDSNNSWFIFNDFTVHDISEEEALDFTQSWKIPAILYLEKVDINSALSKARELPSRMEPNILCEDISMSPNRDLSLVKHQPLSPPEIPMRGTLVAIDAEFVQMQQEEIEYRADGTKKVIRPSRLSLARVSVLRGEGPLQGIPFIDDYIHTSETIVDYLTEFSGIKFGDLDPHSSRHTLVPLKTAYKKLRLLVDLGCVFIGHGLSKDFRIINIFVPRNQVIDTVDLYFLEDRQRRLSLRFLTWIVLQQEIQTDEHDSIEDARSALQLYNAYEQYQEEGTFHRKLLGIYRDGKQYGYKPPVDRGLSTSPAPPTDMGPVHPSTQSSHAVPPLQSQHLVPVDQGLHARIAGGAMSPPLRNFFSPPPQRPDMLNDGKSWRRPQ